MNRGFSTNFEATLYALEYSTTERATLSICKPGWSEAVSNPKSKAHITTNEEVPLLTHWPSVQTGPLRLPSWPQLSEDKAGSEAIR